jgi:hypothetical protein
VLEDCSAHAQCCLRILLTNIVRNISEVLRRPPSKVKLHCSKRRKAASTSGSVENWRRSGILKLLNAAVGVSDVSVTPFLIRVSPRELAAQPASRPLSSNQRLRILATNTGFHARTSVELQIVQSTIDYTSERNPMPRMEMNSAPIRKKILPTASYA